MVSKYLVRECADVEKPPVDKIAECREAALSLGYWFELSHSSSTDPKGCFINHETVRWNTHEIGSGSNGISHVICKTRGKYIFYCIQLYQNFILKVTSDMVSYSKLFYFSLLKF